MVAFVSSVPFGFCANCCNSFAPISSLTTLRFRAAPSRRCPTRLAPRMDANPTPEPPEGSIISKALEISFRNVWIRLMTKGVGREYEEAIQAFVVACVAAYKAGYSITALKLELSANAIDGQYMGRDISLNEQEKETRLIWITLVYLTLGRCGFKSDNPPPPVSKDLKGTKLEPLLVGLSGLVESVCDAAKRGYNLQTFKMELNFKSPEGSSQMSSAQANVRSQWSRIVFATVNILPDFQLGNTGK